MLSKIRRIENMHIALWLFKDMCWVMFWKTGGMLMIVPTILVAFYITWISRKVLSELLHNLAISCWICANATWMTGEFFFNDGLRKYALVFFVVGISIIFFYYLFLFKSDREHAESQ